MKCKYLNIVIKSFTKCIVLLAACFIFSQKQSTAQEKQIQFSLEPMLGLDLMYSPLYKEYRNLDYIYFRRASTSFTYNASLGLRVDLLDDWQFALRWGNTGYGIAYHYNSFYSWGKKDGGSGGSGNFLHSFSGSAEYSFAKFKGKRYSSLENWGVHLQAGLGLAYSYIYLQDRTNVADTSPSIGLSPDFKTTRILQQKKDGEMSIQLGLNAQLIHKDKKFVKLGLWYIYTPNEAVEGKVIFNEYGSTYEERFHMPGSRHKITFYASIPIRLFKIKY